MLAWKALLKEKRRRVNKLLEPFCWKPEIFRFEYEIQLKKDNVIFSRISLLLNRYIAI